MKITISRRLLGSAISLAVLLLAGAVRAEDKPIDTSRVISIGGAVTEIVYALGRQDSLVARDTTSYFPEEASKLPDIGYMRALSPEGVLSVSPTAILMIEGSGPKTTLDVLSKASVPIVTIPEGYDKNGIVAKIKAVGKALGEDAKAEELAAKAAADVDAAEAAAAAIPADKRKRVLFVLSVQNGKIMAAGEHTAAAGILKLVGAVNATSGFHGYKPLNDEAVIEARPDVILMMQHGGPSSATDEQILGNPAIALTPAGKSKTLYRVSSLALLGFGPRTGVAVRDLAKTLYGE